MIPTKMPTSPALFHAIRDLQQVLGRVTAAINRLIFCVSLLGTCFFLAVTPVSRWVSDPVSIPAAKGLFINTFELSMTEEHLSIKNFPSITPSDPNWDGVVSGMCLGYGLGQSVPVAGPALGLALGGWLGYQLDQQI